MGSKYYRQYCLIRDNKRLLRIVRAYITKRLNEGETLTSIAEEIGVERKQVNDYYNHGNRRPGDGISQINLFKLCKYLGISIDLKIEKNV